MEVAALIPHLTAVLLIDNLFDTILGIADFSILLILLLLVKVYKHHTFQENRNETSIVIQYNGLLLYYFE